MKPHFNGVSLAGRGWLTFSCLGWACLLVSGLVKLCLAFSYTFNSGFLVRCLWLMIWIIKDSFAYFEKNTLFWLVFIWFFCGKQTKCVLKMSLCERHIILFCPQFEKYIVFCQKLQNISWIIFIYADKQRKCVPDNLQATIPSVVTQPRPASCQVLTRKCHNHILTKCLRIFCVLFLLSEHEREEKLGH